jgi:hypothetical protein
MPKVDFCVDLRFARAIEHIGDSRKWIFVLLRDLVKASEVDAKSKGPIFLLDEENWSAVW